jgi:3-oxoacyl-[acyl-carrier-protein] synthase III
VRRLTESTTVAIGRAGWELKHVDMFVYHQANARILRAVRERLDVPEARVADYVGDTGTTSAASIPLTLALLREDGRLLPGHRLLVAAIGAGFTRGAGTIEWEID